MSGMRNLMSFDFKSDDARRQKDFIKKEIQIKLISAISNLLQRRIYKYTLPSLERFRRSLQCFCSRKWPGSILTVLAMYDPELLQKSNKGRRGLDIRIEFPKHEQRRITISGIEPIAQEEWKIAV